MKIVTAWFQDSDDRYGDKEVRAILEDGQEEFVFAWFSDELNFKEAELLGLTLEQARDLKQSRDISYLRA